MHAEMLLRKHVTALLQDMSRIVELHAVGENYYIHGRLDKKTVDALCELTGSPPMKQLVEEANRKLREQP